jgi:putative endonuclease
MGNKSGDEERPIPTLGKRGEALACRLLKEKGYKIIERNFLTPIGEIDIVAREGQTLVFVEVKTRESDAFGSAKWAVDRRKQQKLSRVALYYLNLKAWQDRPARFDVVAVDMEPGGERIELFRNAFDLVGV